MIVQNEDDPNGSYTATSASDFKGWNILRAEDWKPGIKRVSMTRHLPDGNTFLIVFVEEKIFKEAMNATD